MHECSHLAGLVCLAGLCANMWPLWLLSTAVAGLMLHFHMPCDTQLAKGHVVTNVEHVKHCKWTAPKRSVPQRFVSLDMPNNLWMRVGIYLRVIDVLFWAYFGDAGFCCWALVGVRSTCRSRKPSTMHSVTPLSEKGFLLSFFMCLVCLTFLPSVLLNSGGDQKMWITSFAEAKNQQTVNETRSWTAVSWVQDRLISRACHSRTCRRVIVST